MFIVKRSRAIALVCLTCCVLAAWRIRADEISNLVARLQPVEPNPALIAAARTNNIPIEGIDTLTETNVISPGDCVTALITLQKKSRQTQWLVYLEATGPAAKTASTNEPEPMVLYTSTDHRLEFASSKVGATVRTLGPFSNGSADKWKDDREQITLDKGFLGVGFDQATAAILRLRTTKLHGSFGIAGHPFKDAEIAEGRKLAEAVKLTSAEERAMTGSVPALISYLGIIQQTPGLAGIFLEIVDLPPVWSMIRHAGIKNANLFFDQKRTAALSDPPIALPANPQVFSFGMDLDLDGHRALDLTFLATSPRPPLLACAGIVGLLAERPGDSNSYLTLKVISARRTTNK